MRQDDDGGVVLTPVDVGEGRIEGIPCLSHDCRVAALEAALQEGLGLEPAWQLGT